MKFKALFAAAVASLLTATVIAFGQSPGINSTLNSVWTYVGEPSTYKATYSASSGGSPASSATDVCTLTGSATKTIRLRRIIFTGITTSTVATNPVLVYKYSTAASGGTATTMTDVPYDSTSSAGSAAAKFYTANPTIGTAVGLLSDKQYTFALTTSVTVPTLEFKFGELGSPVILNSAAQYVSVNLGAATVAGPVACTFEWTEE